MTTVLVTGGIGSGKSQVCNFLTKAGIPVYDSDSQAKRLYDESAELAAAVADSLGRRVLDAEGHIDKRALARVVFGDKEALARLEAIVHPAVYEDFRRYCSYHADAEIVVLESAIALERGYPDGLFDKVVFVDAPVELRVARAAKRDSRDIKEIEKRVAAQSSCAEDPRIDIKLINDGSLEDLERATEQLIEKLKR